MHWATDPAPGRKGAAVAERDVPSASFADADRIDADRIDADRINAERINAERIDADRINAEWFDDAEWIERLDRTCYRLTFSEDFASPTLDPDRWVDHYLPQWTTPDRSVAHYAINDRSLELRIDADQLPWRDEDGGLRVSNIQTGTFSGPMGSTVGTHRYRDDLRVRTAMETRHLWTPTEGLVEATLEATRDGTCLVAIWLVGHEASDPQDSGEICIAEVFGSTVGPLVSTVRLGVKALNDPRLQTDVSDILLPIDATQPHTYAAAWSSERVEFYVDDRLVRTVEQGVAYPMQLMIDLFEFRGAGDVDARMYPKRARVRSVRGYRGVADDQTDDARPPSSSAAP
jgi:hypothetical protein